MGSLQAKGLAEFGVHQKLAQVSAIIRLHHGHQGVRVILVLYQLHPVLLKLIPDKV